MTEIILKDTIIKIIYEPVSIGYSSIEQVVPVFIIYKQVDLF